jgi:predicted lipid-binding transport protein (Tim44 family)
MDTFQFADIMILALIAGFVALRLRNTLGKDVGHRPDSAQIRRQMAEEIEERVTSLQAVKDKLKEEATGKKPKPKAEDDLSDKLKKEIKEIQKHDPEFEFGEFLEGAKGAFEWVLKAYNDGDKSTLKNLLSDEIYQEFESAMIERESGSTKLDTTLVSIDKAEVQEIEVNRKTAQIIVKFLSDQIQVQKDESGKVVSGNASEITRVEDEWVFERPLTSRDPNWTVIDS